MTRLRRRSVVALANDQVTITDACRAAGMDIPDAEYVRGRKLHCPFEAFYHRDFGREPALRIYPDTNHAYCFACATTFTPVYLVAQAWGLPVRTAARELLERFGSRAAVADPWTDPGRPPPDTALLADALRTFCARTAPGTWDDAQYDPRVSELLGGCLALLDRVTTDDAAIAWLAGSKAVMTSALTTWSVYTQQHRL